MKIVIFGADGMLGSDLVKVLEKDHEVIQSLEKALDITDKKRVEDFILSKRADWVINAAAYTNVDGCETAKEKAFAVNVTAPGNIALACAKTGSKLIHFSTDYVFDGTKESPYTEEDEPKPINVYGLSKLQGEHNILAAMKNCIIVRTQWLYGRCGKNFVDTIVNLLKNKSEIQVVDDQFGSPTYTVDLSEAVKKTIAMNIAPGIYNVSNDGYCCWFDFAKAIADLVGDKSTKISPIDSEKLKKPANRPKNSRLDNSKFYNTTDSRLILWKDALRKYMNIE